MKIEMGESLMRSWLRHVQGCQLAELNWKPSSGWEKSIDGQPYLEAARGFFRETLGIAPFDERSTAAQVLRQAEIDVLGVKLDRTGKVEAVYAVDVAYHEKGLQYKDTVGGIMKKLVRGRIVTESYFGDVPHHAIFASPFVRPRAFEKLQEAMEQLDVFFTASNLPTKTAFVANESFRDEILMPTLEASNETADSSELFLRSYRLLAHFGLAGRSPITPVVNSPGRIRSAPSDVDSSPTDDFAPVSDEKIRRWARNPSSKVHQILAVAVELHPLTRVGLLAELQRREISDSPEGAIASLTTNRGNSYGRVFTNSAAGFRFHPDVEPLIREQPWQISQRLPHIGG